MSERSYRYDLSLTSQFYFCSLPLRLDSYSKCTFGCTYCFAETRGGRRPARSLATASAGSLDRRLSRVAGGTIQSVVDELLLAMTPLHFGGMSDPFPAIEPRIGVTHAILEVLARHYYPTVISTKGLPLADSRTIDLLADCNAVVQISLSSLDEKLSNVVEPGVPSPRARLDALTDLALRGVPASVRIQPLLPGRTNDAFEILEECARRGIKQVSLEHLKLPLESTPGIQRLSAALKIDLPSLFAKVGATRMGREWILPVESRLPVVLEVRRRAKVMGLLFGAADTDLLLLSDAASCCSGVDAMRGWNTQFKANYLGAGRIALDRGFVTFSDIEAMALPKRSISQYVNSNSRLVTGLRQGAGIADYLRRNWNGRANGPSPSLLWGLQSAGLTDSSGLKIYEPTSHLKELLNDSALR